MLLHAVWQLSAMKINLDPIPSALIEALRSVGYTLETALADIIDNSITAKAKHISVRFMWNNGKPWIAVVDDGCGMLQDELKEAMRFGSRNPAESREASDLGRFGLGMKTASISQCRQMTVISRQGKQISACEWNLDSIAEAKKAAWQAILLEPDILAKDPLISELVSNYLDSRKSGTIILWRKLESSLGDPRNPVGDERFSAQMDSARKHIELVFHRFLVAAMKHPKIHIDFNDTPLEPFDPFGTTIPARQELSEERISIQGHLVTIQPYVLPHRSKAASVSEYEKYAGEEGYLNNQGFYVYRNRRLIIKATWFRMIPKDELNKLIRIRVDIPNTLDHLWHIDVKKSRANPPETVRQELKRIIGQISVTGRKVFTNRATKLSNRQVKPVWRREIVDGMVRYVVNEEHPILQVLMRDLPSSQADAMRACLELINTTFPYDMYYADAANDKTEFAELTPGKEQIVRVGTQLVRALKSCGFSGQGLRNKLSEVEFFKCSPEIIDEILRLEGEGQ